MRYFSFKMETLADHKLFSVISSQASFNKYEQWYWLGRIWKYQISCHKAEWSNCLTIKKKTHKYYFFPLNSQTETCGPGFDWVPEDFGA